MTTLLILLLALFIERVLWDGGNYRQHQWLERYQNFFAEQRWGQWLIEKPWGTIGLLLPILGVLFILQVSLLPALGWLFNAAFALFILLFSFGPNELGQDTDNYLTAKAVDGKEQTQAIAAKFYPAQENLDMDEQVSRGILYGVCQRLLGPIFWFLLLGPIGAATYRLLSLLAQQKNQQGKQLFHWFDWIPARMTSMGYAITGNFDAVVKVWKQCQQTVNEDIYSGNETLAYCTGQAALSQHTENSDNLVEASLTLAWRNLTLWVVTLSVLMLFSQL